MQALNRFSSLVTPCCVPAVNARSNVPSAVRRSGNCLYLGIKLAAAGGTLAFLAGLDAGVIAACTMLGAGTGAGLFALERHLRPGQGKANALQATVHHAAYNGLFTETGAMLGNLPFATLLQAGFSHFSHLANGVDGKGILLDRGLNATVVQAGPANVLPAGSARDLDDAGFGCLVAASTLPLSLLSAISVVQSLQARRVRAAVALGLAASPSSACLEHGTAASAPRPLAPGPAPHLLHAHLSRHSLLRIAGVSVAGLALLAAPAFALRAAGANEQAVRLLIFSAGNSAGNWVREMLNQATAPAWTAVRRDGEGCGYGLSAVPAGQRVQSTVGSTALSSLLFGAAVGLMHALEISCGTAVVPHGEAILAQPASRFCARLALRFTLVNSTLEMAEALSRGAGFGIYAVLAGTALEYKHRRGAGLFDTPPLLARHLRSRACHQRAAAFAAARSIDGSTVLLLNQIADHLGAGSSYWNAGRIAAILAQAATLARTPLIAAWVLPRHPCNSPGSGAARAARQCGPAAVPGLVDKREDGLLEAAAGSTDGSACGLAFKSAYESDSESASESAFNSAFESAYGSACESASESACESPPAPARESARQSTVGSGYASEFESISLDSSDDSISGSHVGDGRATRRDRSASRCASADGFDQEDSSDTYIGVIQSYL